MAVLFFNLWKLASLKICQLQKIAKAGTKVCQIPNQIFANDLKTLPKWRNFAASGHTDDYCDVKNEPNLSNGKTS